MAWGITATRRRSSRELSAAVGEDVRVSFTPHLAPMTRGILSTIYAGSEGAAGAHAAWAVLRDAYADEPFIRLMPGGALPNVTQVAGSNYLDIGLVHDERTARFVIVAAIDNLVKGASGAAVQNMNLMLGLPEDAGGSFTRVLDVSGQECITTTGGGICAARGVRAAALAAGIKASGKPDMVLLAFDPPAAAAGVYTRNKVCAAPVALCRERIGRAPLRAFLVNSGNANACTGRQGYADARGPVRSGGGRAGLPGGAGRHVLDGDHRRSAPGGTPWRRGLRVWFPASPPGAAARRRWAS